MDAKNSTKSPTCPRCQNQRLIDREPGALLSDGRPDVIVCPRCLGAGPVADRPPGVPLSKPGNLRQAVQEFASKLERVPAEIRALSTVPGEVAKPACVEARTYPLRHEVTEQMDALTMRCLRQAGVVA